MLSIPIHWNVLTADTLAVNFFRPHRIPQLLWIYVASHKLARVKHHSRRALPGSFPKNINSVIDFQAIETAIDSRESSMTRQKTQSMPANRGNCQDETNVWTRR
jgi:hypothetical protein